MTTNAKTKVVTGKVRLSFVTIFEPKVPPKGGEPKYSVTVLVPKSDTSTVQKMKEAVIAARDVYCSKNGEASLPAQPTTIIHDGNGLRPTGEPFGPECKDHFVFTAKSKNKPVIVDAAGNPILDAMEVYSGCYGRVSCNFFAYSNSGNKGISAGLLSVQKLCDGEPLGIVGSADDFNDGYSDSGDDDAFR